MRNRIFVTFLLAGCAGDPHFTGWDACNADGTCSNDEATVCHIDNRCYIPCGENGSCPQDGIETQLCHEGLCYFASNLERLDRWAEAKHPHEETAEACANGTDDNEDGWTDCEDQDCWIFVACADHAAESESEEEPAPFEDSVEECLNDVDDDGDGRIDCAERACSIYTFCENVEPEPGPE